MSTPEKDATAAAEESGPISVMTDALRERLKSPFFSAVVIAWVLINWRAILFVAFDSSSILARILFVDAYFLTFWKSIGLPIIAAFAYIATSPWSSNAIGWWRGKSERRINFRKLEDLDALSKKQRDIDDPGGLRRELKQLNEDVIRAKEFLSNTLKLEAQAKERTANIERESIEKAKLFESETHRHKAARDQIEKDIQAMSGSKEHLISEIAALREERDSAKHRLRADASNHIDVERAKKIVPLLRHRGVPIEELRKTLAKVGLSEQFIGEVTATAISPQKSHRVVLGGAHGA